jgi:hypothetical protein
VIFIACVWHIETINDPWKNISHIEHTRQKASLGQWIMAEQRLQERHPTAAKDTHELPARRPSWTRVANRRLTAVSAHERASTIASQVLAWQYVTILK